MATFASLEELEKYKENLATAQSTLDTVNLRIAELQTAREADMQNGKWNHDQKEYYQSRLKALQRGREQAMDRLKRSKRSYQSFLAYYEGQTPTPNSLANAQLNSLRPPDIATRAGLSIEEYTSLVPAARKKLEEEYRAGRLRTENEAEQRAAFNDRREELAGRFGRTVVLQRQMFDLATAEDQTRNRLWAASNNELTKATRPDRAQETSLFFPPQRKKESNPNDTDESSFLRDELNVFNRTKPAGVTQDQFVTDTLTTKQTKPNQFIFDPVGLSGFENRVLASQRREERFQTSLNSPGMQRIQGFASLITFGRGAPIEQRGIGGFAAETALSGILGAPFHMKNLGGFGAMSLDKTALTVEGMFRRDTRKNVFAELKRPKKDVIDTYKDPRTYVSAAIFAFPAGIGRLSTSTRTAGANRFKLSFSSSKSRPFVDVLYADKGPLADVRSFSFSSPGGRPVVRYTRLYNQRYQPWSAGDYFPSRMFESRAGKIGGRSARMRSGRVSKVQLRKQSFNTAYNPNVKWDQGAVLVKVRNQGLKQEFVKERKVRMNPLSREIVSVQDVGLRTDMQPLKGIGNPPRVRYRRSQTLAGIGRPLTGDFILTASRASKPYGGVVPFDSRVGATNVRFRVVNKAQSSLITTEKPVSIGTRVKASFPSRQLPNPSNQMPSLAGGAPDLSGKSRQKPVMVDFEPEYGPDMKQGRVVVNRGGFRRGMREKLFGRLHNLAEQRKTLLPAAPRARGVNPYQFAKSPAAKFKTNWMGSTTGKNSLSKRYDRFRTGDRQRLGSSTRALQSAGTAQNIGAILNTAQRPAYDQLPALAQDTALKEQARYDFDTPLIPKAPGTKMPRQPGIQTPGKPWPRSNYNPFLGPTFGPRPDPDPPNPREPRIPKFPFFPMLPRGGFGSGRNRPVRTKQPLAYVPSAYAVAFNIRGPKPTEAAIKSGLAVRPIITRRRRRK